MVVDRDVLMHLGFFVVLGLYLMERLHSMAVQKRHESAMEAQIRMKTNDKPKHAGPPSHKELRDPQFGAFEVDVEAVNDNPEELIDARDAFAAMMMMPITQSDQPADPEGSRAP